MVTSVPAPLDKLGAQDKLSGVTSPICPAEPGPASPETARSRRPDFVRQIRLGHLLTDIEELPGGGDRNRTCDLADVNGAL